jgi:hypothetical protein
MKDQDFLDHWLKQSTNGNINIVANHLRNITLEESEPMHLIALSTCWAILRVRLEWDGV